jgi:hypothetical protein
MIFFHENNLKPTLTISIYHNNEIGKPSKKVFAPIGKRYHNVLRHQKTVPYNKSPRNNCLVIWYYGISEILGT